MYYKDVIENIISNETHKKIPVPPEPEKQPEEVLTIWQQITKEEEDKAKEIKQYKLSKATPCQLVENPVVKKIRIDLLILLQKVMEDTLAKAVVTGSLETEKTIFNGIDHIAQLLWNLNPRHPARKEKNLDIHDMDWVKQWLVHSPRPYFPLSWILSKNRAATKIQSYVRGYLVRKRKDVQEMRNFWKVMRLEQQERITFTSQEDD